jgi:hypothetical protein
MKVSEWENSLELVLVSSGNTPNDSSICSSGLRAERNWESLLATGSELAMALGRREMGNRYALHWKTVPARALRSRWQVSSTSHVGCCVDGEKLGDAVGRQNWESSFLRDPNAKFFCENEIFDCGRVEGVTGCRGPEKNFLR